MIMDQPSKDELKFPPRGFSHTRSNGRMLENISSAALDRPSHQQHRSCDHGCLLNLFTKRLICFLVAHHLQHTAAATTGASPSV